MRCLAAVIFFGYAAFSVRAEAKSLPACSPHVDKGDECEVSIDALRPTQLTYGEVEVDSRAEDIARLSASKLQDYLKDHSAPIAFGPGGAPYILDHHHMALAVASVYGRHFKIRATVEHDWSDESAVDFWQKLGEKSLLWLYDEGGRGPYGPDALPETLFELHDDPYRSVAWAVRKAGGYDETDSPHADFEWAGFFRTHLDQAEVSSDFDRAVDDGVKLAESRAAAALPGFHGRSH